MSATTGNIHPASNASEAPSLEAPSLETLTLGQLISAVELLTGEGHTGRSLELYKSWIAANSDHELLHVALFNYGVSLAAAGDIAGAMIAMRNSLRIRPEFTQPHVNLGRLLEMQGKLGPAILEWRRGLDPHKDVTGVAIVNKTLLLLQIARVLESVREDDAAEDGLHQAVDISPHHPEAAMHLCAIRQRLCKWPAVTPHEQLPVAKQLAAMSPLSLSSLVDDPVLHLGGAHAMARRTISPPTRAEWESVPRRLRTRKAGRLRIGYVSSDLRQHAVGLALSDVFETHDRSRFEIFAYYCGVDHEDAVRQRLRAASDHWIDINGLSDAQAAHRIAEDGIDILVDLNGYTRFARTRVFALRPAPVQVNWFGYPGTMGTPYHHYIVADSVIIPEGSEMFYTEEVVRLPCYQPNDRRRPIAERAPTRAEAGLPETGFVFCSFNGAQKLTRRVFDLWLVILNATPDSVLWMLDPGPSAQARLLDYARQRGIASERFVMAPKVGNADHLARYPLADLFLDSFPYGAHTTAADALWMGVPILTRIGRGFAARVCASVLTAAGAPELIAANDTDYVRAAVGLATNRDVLSAIRGKLQATKAQSTLFDTPKLVGALEASYLEMARRSELGRTPAPDLRNLETYHEVAVKQDYEATDAMSDDAYFNAYREALAERDLVYPIAEDSRLWRRAALMPARRISA